MGLKITSLVEYVIAVVIAMSIAGTALPTAFASWADGNWTAGIVATIATFVPVAVIVAIFYKMWTGVKGH